MIKDIEKKWQKYWKEKKIFYTDLNNHSKPKKYLLTMFPYPSGNGLHVGHIRTYTIGDVMARFYRMKGYNVLFPMGWDAFGLPAEQHAIQTNHHPAKFTADNIQNFKKQLQKMGFSFDWEKEINTSEPDYYQWTQWIFKQIYLQGLAEYKEIPVYWCEKLGTVLSNEEIRTIDGKKFSERGFHPVIKKFIPQWILKITKYAKELLIGLQQVDWPGSIKSLQTNWIGLASGTLVDFLLVNGSEKITVFTMSVQTLYGVIAIALSSSHPLIAKITKPEYREKIIKFCTYWNLKEQKEEKEIFGEFTGSYCINPINGKIIPIWVTNFVIVDYGTGAIMINPFQEEIFNYSKIDNLLTEKEIKQNQKADFAFAKKYSLPINKIIEIDNNSGFFVNSPLINDLKTKKEAVEIINNHLEKIGRGKRHNTYHLRDWIFSRQRYWGEPIPVVHWENGKQEILKDGSLPLELPHLNDFTPSSLYYSPLEKIGDWVNIKTENGELIKRDVNVMPQWAGSCWYYIAYLLREGDVYLPLNSERSKEIIKYWLPVDLYIGGQEYATSHLLYARFWHKFLQKIGIVSCSEPFQKLFSQGIILGTDGEKMSKSKGNIVNPDKLIENYGADALRLAIIFLAPPEQTTSFKIERVRAMSKWLEKIYNFFIKYKEEILLNIENKEISLYHYEMVKKVNKYYEESKLNLIIPCLMVFLKQIDKAQKKIMKLDYFLSFLLFLNPIAPHITEEMWKYFEKKEISYFRWPKINENEKITKEKINLIVQINGKKKEIIEMKIDKNKEEVVKKIYEFERLRDYLETKKISKVIFVKNKLVNFVIPK